MNADELSESSHPRFEQSLLQFSRWNLDELNDRLDLQNVPVPNAPFLCTILLQKSAEFCFETDFLFWRQTIQEGLKKNLIRETLINICQPLLCSGRRNLLPAALPLFTAD